MNDLVKIDGIVGDFERTTDTSGTTNRTSTTHISIFKVGSTRVLLKTAVPSAISNGDQVVLAGINSNGQFHALACKNLTANWISPLKQQGCAFSALIGMAVVSFALFFMILPVIFGGVCLFFAFKVKKHDNTLKQAHQMVQNA
jgi:hypothetical protein